MNFFVENKEWLFSGLGIFALSFLVKIFFFKKEKNYSTSGNNSPIIKGNNNTLKNNE